MNDTETPEQAARLDRLAGLLGKGAEGVDLASEIAQDLRGRDEEIRNVLNNQSYAKDQPELLPLLQKLADVLTGQKG